MPTVTEKVVPAFAHCSSGRCPGYKQEPVEGVRTVTETTYQERNGSGSVPGVEFSTETVRFADEEADGRCPHCDGPRGISEQQRPEYAHQSGQPQDALLRIGQTDATVKDLAHAAELGELKREREMKEMRALIEAQSEQLKRLTEQPAKRGPGRPPKAPSED